MYRLTLGFRRYTGNIAPVAYEYCLRAVLISTECVFLYTYEAIGQPIGQTNCLQYLARCTRVLVGLAVWLWVLLTCYGWNLSYYSVLGYKWFYTMIWGHIFKGSTHSVYSVTCNQARYPVEYNSNDKRQFCMEKLA